MLWIILFSLSSILIAVSSAFMGYYGFTVKSYVIYCTFTLAGTGWMLPLAYSHAPSFFQGYIISLSTIGLFGWLISILWFNEMVTPVQELGAVMIVIGSALLIFK